MSIIYLLQQAVIKNANARKNMPLVREARKLLEVPAAVSQDTRHFTTDPRLLLAHRNRVASMIERLNHQ